MLYDTCRTINVVRQSITEGPFRWLPNSILGVQNYTFGLCSTCAICATGFQNLCYLLSLTISLSVSGGWRNASPKLVLGVQSGVNELCSTCAICATGFQNLCYLLSVTISLSVSGGWRNDSPKLVLGGPKWGQ